MQHSLDTTRPYDGIQEVLLTLRQYFFPHSIEVAVGEHEAEGIRKKPAPDTVIEALSQLGVNADNAVYVGDSDVDLQTARNAGLPCISDVARARNTSVRCTYSFADMFWSWPASV